MSKLNEIEAASDDLSPEEKRQLIVFLAARLRAGGSSLPEPRSFSSEQMNGWIAEDEADMRRFQAGKGETQYVTVLEIPPVESQETAVKVAIAAEVRGKK